MGEQPDIDSSFSFPASIGNLADLARTARGLLSLPGCKFLAAQIERAVVLTDALQLQKGQKVLVMNAPLGKPWNLLAMQLCGCEVTILGDSRRQLLAIREEMLDLAHRHPSVPGLPDLREEPTRARGFEFRVGQINLFFPEEDRFNAICLFMVSKGNWGFGPETVLNNSLRGLREGGKLLAGFLDPAWTDPNTVRRKAAAGGFDLEQAGTTRAKYEDYAAAGLLFTLREKSGRTVGFELLAGISNELIEQTRSNLSLKVQNATQLVRELGIRKGANILVVGPSPDWWPERVMAALAGKIDIVLTTDMDPDEAGSEFSFFPGIAALEGGLQLQKALRNPNNRVYGPDSLPSLVSLKSFDLICLTDTENRQEEFQSCLAGLKPTGKLLLGFLHPGRCDIADLLATAAAKDSEIELKQRLKYGTLPAALFERGPEPPDVS